MKAPPQLAATAHSSAVCVQTTWKRVMIGKYTQKQESVGLLSGV